MATAGDVDALPGDTVFFTAGENLTKGDVVTISGDATVSKAGASPPIGVVWHTTSSGEQVPVVVGVPIIYVTFGAAVTAGDWVKNQADHKVDPIARDGTEEEVLGLAVEGGNDTDVKRIAFMPGPLGSVA